MDRPLKAALEDAKGPEILRAIMLLQPEVGRIREDEAEGPDPSAFSSREDYRRALIEAQRKRLHSALGGTMKRLEEMSLDPKGGDVTTTVVVEGPARSLLAALELPGVTHASLDQPVSLGRPRRPNHLA